jgi:Leucine-rich repeat (LRR) protein
LRRLFLDRNAIVQLDGIDSLRNLEELDLAYNALESISDIAGLERLQRLNLTQTGLSSLSGVLSLGDMDLLRISGNPDLECTDIAAAIAEYGESSVRTDRICPGDTDSLTE